MIKTIALILFIAMYVLMIAFPGKRLIFVWGTALIFLAAGVLPLSAVPSAVNWNALMMIAGTMMMVDYFIDSRMPNRLAEKLMDKASSQMWLTIYMSLFSGFISAFVDNVATVLMLAPVGLAICRKLGKSPVAMILSIAVSSNLQGAATLVGDTTSIMLGAAAHMDFMDFFWMNGKPGIFFAVELGALATVPVMMFLFREDRQPAVNEDKTEVLSPVSGVFLVLTIVFLIAASFFPNKPENTNGMICIGMALLLMAIIALKHGTLEHANKAFAAIDRETLLLLSGLFIVIEGITRAGVIDDFAALIVKAGGKNLFILYTVIVWGSVLISAFVDNIPYVATMLPVLYGVT